jgi:hypothetical protein
MANKTATTLGQIILAIVNVPTEMFGTLLDVINKLTSKENGEFVKKLKHLLRDEVVIVLPNIIKWLGRTTTRRTTREFIAKERFRKDSKEVKFYEIAPSFKKWFLSGNGKIEDPLDNRTLRYGNLTRNYSYWQIIEELGGKEKAETTLAELWDQLEKQPEGANGYLLTDGSINIFYVKDTQGELRAVRVYWYGSGWGVHADYVENPDGWISGYRVFCRNS